MKDMRETRSPTPFQRALMLATAAMALFLGIFAVADPAGFLTAMQMGAEGPAAFNEMRAQYGGFFLALGLFLVAGAAGRANTRAALWAMVIMYGGIFLGRILHLTAFGGWADFPAYNLTMQIVHAVDGAGFILSLIALRQSSS